MRIPDLSETEPKTENIASSTTGQIGSLTLKEWVVSDVRNDQPVGRFEAAIRDRVAAGFEAGSPAMTSLVDQLAPSIRDGRWTTVLGDDSKGRLPALVIGGLTSRWAQEHGQHPPARKFIAGGRTFYKSTEDADHNKVEADRHTLLMDYVADLKPGLGERTLVVTEYVTEGRGMEMLLRALRENDVLFDLAIVEAWGKVEDTVRHLHDLYPHILNDSDIYIGRGSLAYEGRPAFAHDEHGLTGATGVSRTEELQPVASATGDSRTFTKAARAEVTQMTDRLYTRLQEQ